MEAVMRIQRHDRARKELKNRHEGNRVDKK